MMQLRESGSRNHGANFGEGCVVANAVRFIRNAEPDAAAGSLDGARQSAIVDDLAANSGNAADAIQG